VAGDVREPADALGPRLRRLGRATPVGLRAGRHGRRE
jgi:hypothetical protein